MSGGGLLSRLLWRDAEEDDSSTYSAEEIGTRRPWRRGEPEEGQQSRGFSIQRVAETIAELPSTIPREHAVLIVRRTLAAADIKLSELDVSTRAQESQLSSEIELAKNRQKEVLEKTEETVRPLEEELRRAREACDGVVAYEEKKISRALATLKEVRRVRAFFDLPETEGEENADPIAQDAQPLRVLKTQEEGGGSSPPTAADSKVSVGLSNRATASCKSLLAIEVDAFDEFVAKIRGEHAQQPQVQQAIGNRRTKLPPGILPSPNLGSKSIEVQIKEKDKALTDQVDALLSSGALDEGQVNTLKALLKRAGLPATVRLYDLRHTCATLLLSRNVHPKYVQQLLGHASIAQLREKIGNAVNHAISESKITWPNVIVTRYSGSVAHACS